MTRASLFAGFVRLLLFSYMNALGSVIAAEWLKGKKGVFTMKDVLGI